MSSIPQLSEPEIRDRVGEQSYQRGLGYFHNDAVVNPRRQGNTLKALCWGTSEEAYRVAVTFDDGDIARAACTCPIGHGGHCKHVAALLLTWRARPDDFVEIEALESALERRTKPELIALINQMLLREPDLELLLELPLPKGYPSVPPAQADAIRRQAAATFNRHPPGQWGVEGQIADELLNLKTIGDGFATQNDVASAAAVYEALAVEVAENYESYPYDEGELSGVIEACVDSLAGLLTRAEKADARQAILAALVAIFQANVEEAPDYAIGGETAMSTVLEHASADERRVVADWLRAARAAGSGGTDSHDEDDDDDDDDSDYLAEAYDEVLFDLEKDTLDDETFLARARALDRVVDLVDRLLKLGRPDEAVAAARDAVNFQLPAVLNRFVSHGYDELAEQIARDRTRGSADPTLLGWQHQQYARRGNLTEALKTAEELFQSLPSVPLYAQLREYASQLDCWPATRERLQATLRQKNQWSVLVEAQLDDGAIEPAIAVVLGRDASAPADVIQWLGDTALRVAATAEAAHPRDAIEIYVRRAERHIALRQRGNYHEASILLGQVRRLYAKLGETDAWHQFIEELRARYNRLPALKDELASAGL